MTDQEINDKFTSDKVIEGIKQVCCVGVIRIRVGTAVKTICHPCWDKENPDSKMPFPHHAIIAAACDYCCGNIDD